jgi:hypothetical protein
LFIPDRIACQIGGKMVRLKSSSLNIERRKANAFYIMRMKPRHAGALALLGWYLLIPPVFSPMGHHPRAFNDLKASINRWDIQASFESEASCEKEKERIRKEAPLRIQFANEHPDQDQNGNILAVAEAWQLAECVASNDPRLKER